MLRFSLLLGLLLATALGAQAQDDRLDGAFLFAPEASEDVHAAIEQAIDDLNFVVRPIARRRLRAATEPDRRVTFQQDGGDIVISTNDAANPTRSALDGTPVVWTRSNGETVGVATAWRAGTLVHTFTAEDGSRENAYTLSPDGDRLTMEVTVRSPRLPEPVRYTLVYHRAS